MYPFENSQKLQRSGVQDYQVTKINEDFKDQVKGICQILERDISITPSLDNLVERAKILYCYVRRVPNKLNKNGVPVDKNLDKIKPSISLFDYCRLLGFEKNFWKESQDLNIINKYKDFK